jgi:hypothetical protein
MDEATRSNQLSLIVETFCLEKKVTLYEDGLYKELFKRWPCLAFVIWLPPTNPPHITFLLIKHDSLYISKR